jgi:mannitol/fructose-specific phosphotransferase system IIA component (Ntr-type)
MSGAVAGSIQVHKFFAPSSILLDLHSHDRNGVLSELIETIPSISGNGDLKNQLHRALIQREELSCTALGRGVAVPHTRNTIASVAGKTLIVFGRHQKGIDYCAPDHTPVHLFFLLMAPDINRHLQTLARLTRLVREPHLRTDLCDARSAQDVIDAIREAERRVTLEPPPRIPAAAMPQIAQG